MDLNAAIEELYRVPPSEFVQTRRRLADAAQAAGDEAVAKRIRALRRPTVSAWAVNLLVREQGELVGELLELGEEIRRGWAGGEDPARFDRVRNLAVAEAVRVAGVLVEATGRPLGEQAAHEVEETLQAAIVDAEAAEEVRSGRLTHPRSHAGFAVPEAPAPGEAVLAGSEQERVREEKQRRRVEQLEHRAAELAGERDVLRREVEHIEQEEERLRHRLDQLRLHRSAVRRRLEDAEAQTETALARAAEARSALGGTS
ncbi:hypothetical protein [Actinocorallia populi]|uniref:hypothetical protein n=1 Tax=Actinocorallia populi TaxID=2079200 RepID=UPI000D094679|nr:hypothetical protein [Actinocorallia populi]